MLLDAAELTGMHFADLPSAAAGMNLRVVVRTELAPDCEVAEERLRNVADVLAEVSKKPTLA